MNNNAKLIYIAHRLTDGDVEANMASYLRLCAHVMNDLGKTVVSWGHHYMLHSQGLLVRPGAFWLKHDARLLQAADELWVCCDADAELPPDSVGIAAEIQMARAFGVPVRYVWPVDAVDAGWEVGRHPVIAGKPGKAQLQDQTLELILLRAADQYAARGGSL